MNTEYSFIFYQYKNNTIQQFKCKAINSQLNKLESTIKNEAEVVLRLSSNMIGDNETSFPHELLLTNRQVSNLVNLLQIIHQQILSYQKLNYQRSYNQEDFLVDYFVHY